MLVKIEQKYLENLTHHIRGNSIIIEFALRGEGVPSKYEHVQTGRKGIMSLRMLASHIVFLGKYLVHKLRAIITRFFVGFVKISALLKLFVLRNYISFFCLVYN